MKFIKRLVRFVVLLLLIILALSGVGIGAILSPRKERDFDNEVKIELVDRELESNLHDASDRENR